MREHVPPGCLRLVSVLTAAAAPADSRTWVQNNRSSTEEEENSSFCVSQAGVTELVRNSYGQPWSDRNTGSRSTEVKTISSGWRAGVFSHMLKKGSSVSLGNVEFSICAETLIHAVVSIAS